MQIEELFNNKAIKPKEKTEIISGWILNGSLPSEELLAFAEKAKDPVKATCIESFEFATRQNPKVATEPVLDFVIRSLAEKAPRIKWESAKVVGNLAPYFPQKVEEAVDRLLENALHEGTVVRWSAAFALGEILKLKGAINASLIPAAEQICEREEKNSIKKMYQAAFKKIKK